MQDELTWRWRDTGQRRVTAESLQPVISKHYTSLHLCQRLWGLTLSKKDCYHILQLLTNCDDDLQTVSHRLKRHLQLPNLTRQLNGAETN